MLHKKIVIPFVLFVFLLVVVGIIAITQEADEVVTLGDMAPDGIMADSTGDEDEEESLAQWIPPGPPRWFRSNAGGMALEEIPSRLGALRHAYALVIDYVPPSEMEPRLLPFFQDGYTVEIRALYRQEEEIRRQWLFRDGQGRTRLNAVFRNPPEEPPVEEAVAGEPAAGEQLAEEQLAESSANDPAEGPTEAAGFIEIYSDRSLITRDYWFFEDGGEMLVEYHYNGRTLIRAEAAKREAGNKNYIPLHTDHFRYNRALSLRNVERIYHEAAAAEPVFLTFPSRVLDAAFDENFLSETLVLGSEFLENVSVEEGFRMVYDTDSRGRILSQTMLDGDEVVWVITNTWSGDRIIAALKTEGDDEKLTEYEYDGEGNRIVQRDINNGVLERRVHTEGIMETEELFLNGVVVLRAYWENGRKIHEERVRQ